MAPHTTASARIAERLAKRLRVFKSLAVQDQER